MTTRRKPLNAEQARILSAVEGGRFHENANGRYVIDGEDRPDRKERERMVKRGYIAIRHDPARPGTDARLGSSWRLTPAGAEMLSAAREEH